MSLAVSVDHVVKEFGALRALDDVTFSVARGEIYGVLGPNGAGKTTLLHILLGLTTPTSGRLGIFGMDVATERERCLSRVNFSSAYTALPSRLTVFENLTVFAHLYDLPKPKQRAREVVEQFGLGDRATQMTGTLSSGWLTRLNLAKAMLNEPEVLFLDEPTASLDPDTADRIRTLLVELRRARNLTIIYTSHNMNEVEALCDRVMFLHKGRLLVEGSPESLRTRYGVAHMEDVFLAIARGDGSLPDAAREDLPKRFEAETTSEDLEPHS
ncbi:ABC transporter ATP-binding protein [Myxococcota bacterium]|nr:ABC transporter ATP-binding protein [Myxococcota bacterium]